jgi:entericidin B
MVSTGADASFAASAGLNAGISTSRGTHMTRFIAMLLLAGATIAATGCNTMAGAGQDISKGGNAITNSAEKHE